MAPRLRATSAESVAAVVEAAQAFLTEMETLTGWGRYTRDMPTYKKLSGALKALDALPTPPAVKEPERYRRTRELLEGLTAHFDATPHDECLVHRKEVAECMAEFEPTDSGAGHLATIAAVAESLPTDEAAERAVGEMVNRAMGEVKPMNPGAGAVTSASECLECSRTDGTHTDYCPTNFGSDGVRWRGAAAAVPEAPGDNCERCKGRMGGVRGNENVVYGMTLCDYCHAFAVKVREPVESERDALARKLDEIAVIMDGPENLVERIRNLTTLAGNLDDLERLRARCSNQRRALRELNRSQYLRVLELRACQSWVAGALENQKRNYRLAMDTKEARDAALARVAELEKNAKLNTDGMMERMSKLEKEKLAAEERGWARGTRAQAEWINKNPYASVYKLVPFEAEGQKEGG